MHPPWRGSTVPPMSTAPSVDPAAAAIGRIFELADQWHLETTGPPPMAEPGSALAGDDARLGGLQLSHLAWTSHLSAVEHLYVIRVLIVDAKRLDPHAAYTLIRSALESAAGVVWLLAPGPRAARLARALRATGWTPTSRVKCRSSPASPRNRRVDLRTCAWPRSGRWPRTSVSRSRTSASLSATANSSGTKQRTAGQGSSLHTSSGGMLVVVARLGGPGPVCPCGV
jgi:hypothetical protein